MNNENIKLNEGLVDIKEIFRRFGNTKYKPSAKASKFKEFQDLALQIIKEFNIPKKEHSWIFSICRKYPKDYIKRQFEYTKKRAKGEKRGHYFIKIIYKK